MHGVHDNNSGGQKGREKRNRECDELIKKYFNNCKFSDERLGLMMFAFSDTTTSLIQAIECYRYGYFDASMTMLRNSIDASTYAALCYRIQFDDKTGRVNSLVPIESVLKYRCYKKWDKRKDEILSKGLLDSEQIDMLYKIRDEGNFSAHIYEIKRDRFYDVLTRTLQGKRKKGELPKQFTTETENRVHLKKVVDILMELHNNYVKNQRI